MTMTATAQEVIPMRTTALEFAEIARALQNECHRLRIEPPAFRAPPRHRDAPRTITRHPEGVVVRVRLDRDPHAVTSDLIDGCIQAANVSEAEGETLRTALWLAAGQAVAA